MNIAVIFIIRALSIPKIPRSHPEASGQEIQG
jgi:hypothetical protein